LISNVEARPTNLLKQTGTKGQTYDKSLAS